MKRFVVALVAIGSVVFGFTPTADAVGYGACAVAGSRRPGKCKGSVT